MTTNPPNGKLIDRSVDLGALRPMKTIYIPELDCSVTLRALSIAQVQKIASDPALQRNPVQQLALTIVDTSGKPMYTTAEDIANLSELSSTIAARLIQEAALLNGSTLEELQAQVDAHRRNAESVTG